MYSPTTREANTYTYRLPAGWVSPLYYDDHSAMSADESDRFHNTMRVIEEEIGAWDSVGTLDDENEFGRYDMPAQVGVSHGPVRTFCFTVITAEGHHA